VTPGPPGRRRCRWSRGRGRSCDDRSGSAGRHGGAGRPGDPAEEAPRPINSRTTRTTKSRTRNRYRGQPRAEYRATRRPTSTSRSTHEQKTVIGSVSSRVIITSP
jgi:hypothetical protein